MTNRAEYNSLDLLISQLEPMTQSGIDPLILSSWAGIVAVEAVTAFELSIKQICEEFARKKHKVFGSFVRTSYERLNGRISYKDLKDGIVKPYGEKYYKRLINKKESKTAMILASDRVDLVQSYDNLIMCRNRFVHAGVLTLSFSEAVKFYQIGKNLIDVLDETMKR